MHSPNALENHIKATALQEGALLVGFTKIRRVDPVILLGFPFTDQWFLKEPLQTALMLGKEYSVSKHVQDVIAKKLRAEGYTAYYKTVLSLYGDFRPLAVSAGLGQWGRNGLVVNKDYGSGLLFAALFTNAPLEPSIENQQQGCQEHCTSCGQCIEACPGKAFTNNRFHTYNCLSYTMKGCAECLRACSKKTSIH
ncbi:MAG: hypothetical protein K0R93_441 [Anaerosolibacter sp.]|jgi:epoxyqueuosine reductase|uniref:4Fe-4S binding protein n=1 Tax=Anaerosolibacter sp. TaxID=1872527 RepID=UPI002639FD8C|nr:4Fe-4S binding protein [Anaerosolibacter sp.]MDF2545543.1 hypothetical protein [Anaerosolibacter sp.]